MKVKYETVITIDDEAILAREIIIENTETEIIKVALLAAIVKSKDMCLADAAKAIDSYTG